MTGQPLLHIEKLRALEGRLRSDVARELGLCEPYVVKLAKDNGIALAKNPSPTLVLVEKLRPLAAAGLTMQEAAAEIGIVYVYVTVLARKHDIKFIRSGLSLHPTVREQQMAALYRSGKTLQEIGGQYGITRERVRQLLTKFYGIGRLDGGQHKVGKEKRAKFEARRNAASLKKWGCNWDQYAALRGKPTRCFHVQRQNAAKRGIGWELNLWQWWSIWQQSGKWLQRGRGQGYVMCRMDDVGPYAIGNVFIATARENSSDQKRKKSGLPMGVRKNKKSAGYSAARHINGKKLRLGSHPTPELAHAAYLAAGQNQ